MPSFDDRAELGHDGHKQGVVHITLLGEGVHHSGMIRSLIALAQQKKLRRFVIGLTTISGLQPAALEKEIIDPYVRRLVPTSLCFFFSTTSTVSPECLTFLIEMRVASAL